MLLLTIFIIIPLMEISIFYLVGTKIGLGTTLILCVLTALIGWYLVQRQGLDTLRKGQSALSEGFLPIQEMFDGFCIVIAGALLLTPGFLTDFIGFSLLIPPVRVLLRRVIAQRMEIINPEEDPFAPHRNPRRDDIVEGTYSRLDDDDADKNA